MITLKFRIAVDVDGVLGDQVSPILLELNEKYGIKLSKEDITDWEYPIVDTKIDVEIEEALLDQSYVLEMPVVKGAKEGMFYLWKNHFVVIATSRPKETEAATLKWISSNFKFHEYCNTRGKGKKFLHADILIDDNIQYIKEFSNNNGVGLLFSQPWNENRLCIRDLINRGKVHCCDDWANILKIVKLLESARSN